MTELTTVTEKEKDQIYRLNRRTDALCELDESISKSNLEEDIQIRENIKMELKICREKNQNWWNNIVKKYNLPIDKQLKMNYGTCEISQLS